MAGNTKLQIIIDAKDSASAKLKQLQVNIDGASKKIQKFTPSVKKLKGAFVAASIAINVAGGFALREAAKFENLQAKFEVLLGSTEAAAQRIREVNELALVTPFQVAELATASAILQTFAGDALATGDGLRFVGDMAAFAQQPVNEVAVHAGRIVDALESGRPFGESAQRLQELGLVTGENRAILESYKGQILDNKKALEVFQGAVVGVGGTMEKLNNTLTGQLSNVEQQFRDKIKKIGQHIADAFDVKDKLREFSNALSSINLQPLFDIINKVRKIGKKMMNDLKIAFTSIRKVLQTEGGKKMVDTLEIVAKILKKVFVAGWKTALVVVGGIIIFFVAIFNAFGDEIKAIFGFILKVVEKWAKLAESAFQTIASFVKGDFSESWRWFKNFFFELWNGIIGIVESAVNGILRGLNALLKPFKSLTGGASDAAKDFGISLDFMKVKTIDLSNKVRNTFPVAADRVVESSAKMSDSIDNITKGVGGLSKKTGELKSKGAEDIEKFTDKAIKAIANLNDKIKSLNREFAKVTGGFEEKQADNRSKFAEQVVASEEKIVDFREKQSDILSKIGEEEDAIRRQELQNELTVVEESLQKEIEAHERWGHLITRLDTEITEVRRQNSLSSLSRAAESFLKEREASRAAFNEKIALLAEELEKLREQKKEVLEIVDKQTSEIIEFQKTASDKYKESLTDQLSETKKQVEEMISLFNRLAQARAGSGVGSSPQIQARARGGNVNANQTYLVGEKGPELFTSKSSGDIIPNNKIAGSGSGGGITIVINGDISGEEMLEKVTNNIVAELKLHTAIV